MKILGWILVIIAGILFIGSCSNYMKISQQRTSYNSNFSINNDNKIDKAISSLLKEKKNAVEIEIGIESVVCIIGIILINIRRKKKDVNNFLLSDQSDKVMNNSKTEAAALPAKLNKMQQKALWMQPIVLSSIGNGAIGISVNGDGGHEEIEINPETALWALPIIDSIEEATEFAKNGQFEKAIEQYKEILKKVPDAAIVLMSIGTCYAEIGKKVDALKWLEKAKIADPKNKRIHDNILKIQLLF